LKINLADKEYIFLIGYQREVKYRAAFDILAKKVFGISFEEWYQAGYWNEKYIPYTLFDGNKAVGNVSVNIMDFNTLGKPQRYIQIGTVLTDENYRNKKLSRFLMEKVLEEWNDKSDFVYLYANPTALEMYPKFGFTRVKEYEYFRAINKNIEQHENFEKLNMDMQSNRAMLYDYAKNSSVFSKLSMRENADLVMFYCISFFKENVYYIKALDAIAVAKFNNNQLYLLDVFCKVEVELDTIINSLINSRIDEVVLGFTPKDISSYKPREIVEADALFIQKNKTILFDKNKLMFPLLSHA